MEIVGNEVYEAENPKAMREARDFSHVRFTNDSKYVKMLNRKYEIYRGKILKSLKEVVSQIGVNHIVKEDTLKYGKEYDKGFKRVISIYI